MPVFFGTDGIFTCSLSLKCPSEILKNLQVLFSGERWSKLNTGYPKKNRTNFNHARKKSDIDSKPSSYWSTSIRTQLVKCSSTLHNNSKFCGDSREAPSLGITIERPGTARPPVGRNFGPISKPTVYLKNSEVILYGTTNFYWYRMKNKKNEKRSATSGIEPPLF